jgi:hypothetical protein
MEVRVHIKLNNNKNGAKYLFIYLVNTGRDDCREK